MGNLVFNAATVTPASVGGSQLPISDANGHHVRIDNTEIKAAKPKEGETQATQGFLEMTLTILDGAHAGESGPYRLNLYNNSPKAVEIAYAQLSAICHVTGRFQINNHEDLRGAELRAVVGVQKGNADYTEVKGVKDLNGNDPGKSGGQLPQAQPQPQPQAQPQYAPQPQPAPVQGGFQASPPVSNVPLPQAQPQPVQGGFQPQPVQPQPFNQQAPQPAAPWGPQQ